MAPIRPASTASTRCPANHERGWRRAGHWARILAAISKAYNGDIQLTDASSVRVHQHGANGPKRGAIGLPSRRCRHRLAGNTCLARAVARWADHCPAGDRHDPREGTKIHALVDALGRPIRLKLSAGQAHDGHAGEHMLTAQPQGCRLRLPAAGRPHLRQQRHPHAAGGSGRNGSDPVDAAAQPGH